MENVQEIRTELVGSERRLAESLGHSKEIGRLLNMVELDMGSKSDSMKDTQEKLAMMAASLERTQRDLVDKMEESRRRQDDIQELSTQLRNEKAECSVVQARLLTATSSLAQVQRDLADCRDVARKRKEELEMLSLQLLREKGQVSSLKYEVDSRKNTTKELETCIAQGEKRHRDTIIAGEGSKKELEKRHAEKLIEAESLRKTVETLERKIRNSDATQLLRNNELLENTYRSLQRQFQAKEDELDKVEREKEEYRTRLAQYDTSFEPSSLDKTFGLRGKGRELV